MKRGISLIAVLMFMLASTTASVVLYKWLGSEGFASGLRLKKSEAYQASESGLEAVKAWLSYKAADVGLVLNEYMGYKKQGYNNPYKLTDVVAGLSGGKQNFKVYLIGADTATKGKPYKLKFMSVGMGRDGSEVKQTAIFNVEGLYNILVPSYTPPPQCPNPEDCRGPTLFDEDIWGNVSTFGRLDSRRALLTQSANLVAGGGQRLNNVKITGNPGEPGYLILDGSFYVIESMDVNGDMYVTGDFDFCNPGGKITGDLYVGGEFHPKDGLTIEGDAYFEGGVNPNRALVNPGGSCNGKQASGKTVSIWGNSTIKKDFFYYISGAGGGLGFSVGNTPSKGGNLVMDGIGEINLSRNCNNGNSLRAGGNVYIKNRLTGNFPNNCSDATNSIPFFGEYPLRTVCVSGMIPDAGEFYKDDVTPQIKMRSTKTNQTLNSSSCSNYKSWGANPLDGSQPIRNGNCGITCKASSVPEEYRKICDHCKSESDPEGCYAKFLADDYDCRNYLTKLGKEEGKKTCEKPPLEFDKTIYDEVKKSDAKDWVHRENKPGNCAVSNGKLKLANSTLYQNWIDLGPELDACWNQEKNSNRIYTDKNNVKWLVVYMKDGPSFNNSTTPISDGNYIIIFESTEDKMSSNLYLPPTGDNVKVMLYLPIGYPKQKIELIGNNSASTKYNYFIFSDGDINEFTVGADGNRTLTGYIFMNNCSILNTGGTDQILRTRGNKAFVDALIDAGILKEKMPSEGSGDGGSGVVVSSASVSSSSDDGGVSSSSATDDLYIIPLSPRLKVELESKYISKKEEPNPNDNQTLKPREFILVMPRILRLPPKNNEYSYLGLTNYYNLLYLNGASSASSKPPPSSCKINNEEINFSDLTRGVYTCTFSDEKISEFFVMIEELNPVGSSGGGGSSDSPPYGSSSNSQSSSSGGNSSSSDGGGGNLPTVECRLKNRSGVPLAANATLTVTQGENINPPTITCSSGNPYSVIFSASSGILPVNSMGLNWQYYSVYYGNTAGVDALGDNVITLSSVYCDNDLVEGPIPCGTLKVIRPTCKIADGSNGGTVNKGQVIPLEVTCGNAITGKTKFTPSSGGDGALLYQDNLVCFNIASSGTTPRIVRLTSVFCDEHEIVISTSNNPVPCGSTGFIAQASASDCPFTSSSSAASTVECSFPYNPHYVYPGQNINAPEIDCSSGEANKFSATFSASSGAPPSNWTNWQYTDIPASYSSSSVNAVNVITVSGVKCDNVTVAGSKTCGTINVCAHNRVQANNCSDYIGTLTAANTNTPANPYTACFKHTNNKCYVCKITSEGNNHTCCRDWVWNSSQVQENINKNLWYQEVACPVSQVVTVTSCVPQSIGTPNSSNCYTVQRPTITCSDGLPGATTFHIDNSSSPMSNWRSSGDSQMFCTAGNNRPITLNSVKCGDTDVTTDLPYPCGSITIPQPSSSSSSSSAGGGGTDFCYGITTYVTKSTQLGTNAVCAKISGNISGWNGSSTDGRECRINGGTAFALTSSWQSAVTATNDGHVYIWCSAGSSAYFQMSWNP